MEGSLVAYKVFTNGSVLNASEVNDNLMNQSVITFATSTARSSAITSPIEGMITYLDDSNSYQTWDGSAWVGLVPQSPNAIINGAFDIWQRGTSISNATGSTTYTADRWRNYRDGSGATVTISQQTFTPGAAPLTGLEAQYFLRYNQSVAGTSTTFSVLEQPIEDVRTFAGQTVTLSFYAKAAVSQNLSCNISQRFGSGGSATVSIPGQANALTTNWQRFTYTVSIPSLSGKTIGTGSVLGVNFTLPYNTVSTIDIWGVQLEAGSVATPFRRNANSLQGELAGCQRYYHRSQSAAPFLIHSTSGIAVNATTVGFVVQHPVTMRVGPTSVEFSTLTSNDGYSFGSPVTAVTLNQVGPQTALVTATTSGMTTGRFYRLESNNSTAAFIGFSAEL
jgi:hypothetical protein